MIGYYPSMRSVNNGLLYGRTTLKDILKSAIVRTTRRSTPMQFFSEIGRVISIGFVHPLFYFFHIFTAMYLASIWEGFSALVRHTFILNGALHVWILWRNLCYEFNRVNMFYGSGN